MTPETVSQRAEQARAILEGTGLTMVDTALSEKMRQDAYARLPEPNTLDFLSGFAVGWRCAYQAFRACGALRTKRR